MHLPRVSLNVAEDNAHMEKPWSNVDKDIDAMLFSDVCVTPLRNCNDLDMCHIEKI